MPPIVDSNAEFLCIYAYINVLEMVSFILEMVVLCTTRIFNPEVPLLQMVKKDENINCLQTDYEESTKQLTIMKGMLPKVSGDRDMLWERVKQCSEENMLIKKKIEALEEDLLLKDGQITILKDWLGNKFF